MLALFSKRGSNRDSTVGRHTPEYIVENWKDHEYGHDCIGERCRCWGPTVELPDDSLTDATSFFFDPVREVWTEAETRARQLRNTLVNPWKETEDAIAALGVVRWGV